MRDPATLTRILADELATYDEARSAGDVTQAWRALERAHIVSQPMLGRHMGVHLHMLRFAVRLRQPREIAGQIVRLALAPLGALTGRLPWGNTGRANVSAFRPMPIPSDLSDALGERRPRS